MKELIINLFEKNRIIDLVVIQEQSGSRADQCFESLVRNESFKMALAETLLDSLTETNESEFLSKIKEIYRDLEDDRENEQYEQARN